MINKRQFIDIIIICYIVSIFLFSTNTALYTISNYVFAIFAFSALIHIGYYRNYKLSILGSTMLIPIVVFSIITIPFAINRGLASEIATTLISLYLLVLLIINCLKDRNREEVILIAFVIGGLFTAIQVIMQYGFNGIFIGLQSGTRIGSDLYQLNYLGRFSYWTSIIAFFYAYVERKQWLYIIFILSSFVCLGSGSRQAWISLLICMILILFSIKTGETKLRNIFTVFVLVGILFSIASSPVFNEVSERLISGINSMFNDSGLSSDKKRVEMIHFGFSIFISNPVTGIGLGNISEVTTGILNGYGYLHNNYVELLACGGLIGFICYYGIYVKLFKELNNTLKQSNDLKHLNMVKFSIILLVGQLSMDMFAVNYYSKQQYLLFAFCYLVVNRRISYQNRGKVNDDILNNNTSL